MLVSPEAFIYSIEFMRIGIFFSLSLINFVNLAALWLNVTIDTLSFGASVVKIIVTVSFNNFIFAPAIDPEISNTHIRSIAPLAFGYSKTLLFCSLNDLV